MGLGTLLMLVNIVLTVGHYMSIARLIAVTGPEIDDAPIAALPTGVSA